MVEVNTDATSPLADKLFPNISFMKCDSFDRLENFCVLTPSRSSIWCKQDSGGIRPPLSSADKENAFQLMLNFNRLDTKVVVLTSHSLNRTGMIDLITTTGCLCSTHQFSLSRTKIPKLFFRKPGKCYFLRKIRKIVQHVQLLFT